MTYHRARHPDAAAASAASSLVRFVISSRLRERHVKLWEASAAFDAAVCPCVSQRPLAGTRAIMSALQPARINREMRENHVHYATGDNKRLADCERKNINNEPHNIKGRIDTCTAYTKQFCNYIISSSSSIFLQCLLRITLRVIKHILLTLSQQTRRRSLRGGCSMLKKMNNSYTPS